MRFRIVQLAALLIVAAVGSHANAALLAGYNFTGGSSASVATIADPQNFQVHNTTTETSSGTDIALSSSTNTGYLRSDATGSTMTAALNDDDYFSFVVNAPGGELLYLQSLVFSLGGSTNPGATLNNTIYVQSSVDGFGDSNPVIDTRSSTTTNTGGAIVVSTIVPIDLTDAKFQKLASIEFRLFYSDDRDTNGDINRLDNVQLIGSLPTPAALPGGLALMSLAVLRRRGK